MYPSAATNSRRPPAPRPPAPRPPAPQAPVPAYPAPASRVPAPRAPQAQQAPMIREKRLFLGNPGTGKSTLINCLVGQAMLKSGVSYGGGLTQSLEYVVENDVAYMDTPGLADTAIAKQAADAIETALKQGGRYKLFFMMRLQKGRVVSEDMATLELVLGAIDVKPKKLRYSVIFNNVDEGEYMTLIQPASPECEAVKGLVNGRSFKTDSFCFIPTLHDLEEKSNAVAGLPPHVYAFVNDASPSMTIDPQVVRPIDPAKFERHAKMIHQEMERLRSQRAALMVNPYPTECRDATRVPDQWPSRWRPHGGDSANYSEGYSQYRGPCEEKPLVLGWTRKNVIIAVSVVVAVVIVVVISVVATRGRSTSTASAQVPVPAPSTAPPLSPYPSPDPDKRQVGDAGAVQVGCVPSGAVGSNVSLETLHAPMSLGELIVIATYRSLKYIIARGNSSAADFSVVGFNASLPTSLQHEVHNCSNITGDTYFIYEVNGSSTPTLPVPTSANESGTSGRTPSTTTSPAVTTSVSRLASSTNGGNATTLPPASNRRGE